MSRQGSTALVWVVATGIAVAVVAIVLLCHDPEGSGGSQRIAPRTPEPIPGGAYGSGGRPHRESALDRAFAEALPAFAIAVDGWSRKQVTDQDLAARREAVLAPATTAALGAPASARLADLLDRARDAAAATAATVDDRADALATAVIAFDDQLTAAGLAYLVDSDVVEYPDGRRMVLLFSFAVDQVTRYATSSGDPIRALHLRRLDSLNWSYALLGFTTPRRREAFVLIKQIDERLVDRLLPQLAKDPPPFYQLGPAERAASWAARLQARANRVVRREYGETAPDPTAAQRLGGLLARRQLLFTEWSQALAGRGISLEPPTTLQLHWDYRTELDQLIPKRELDQLAELERELASPDAIAAFAAARDRLIASIERHEVQHRLDNTHPDLLPMPRALAALVGQATTDKGALRPPLAELSAYLAELARDRATTGVNLAILTQYLVLEDNWNSAECFAALVILEELATTLGLERVELIRDQEIDRAATVDLFLALTDRPVADIAAAAGRLWERLFGRPLAELRILD